MSKSAWILGAVVAVGFVAESRSVADLQARLRELERQASASPSPRPLLSSAPSAPPEIARQVGQLQDEVGRIWDRLRTPVDRPPDGVASGADAVLTTAVGAEAGAAEAGDDPADGEFLADSAPVALSPELQALLTPENRKVLASAVRAELDEREKKERARRLRRELEDRWSVLSKRLDINPAQAEVLQPIVRDHYRKYAALRDRLAQLPAAKRPAFEQRIAELRRTTETKLQGYLSTTQLPKLRELFHPSPRPGASSGGGKRPVGAPGTG